MLFAQQELDLKCECLRLDNNKITDAGCAILADFIGKTSGPISEIRLCDNRGITIDGLRDIISAIITTKHYPEDIRGRSQPVYLRIFGCDFQTDLLEHMTRLIEGIAKIHRPDWKPNEIISDGSAGYTSLVHLAHRAGSPKASASVPGPTGGRKRYNLKAALAPGKLPAGDRRAERDRRRTRSRGDRKGDRRDRRERRSRSLQRPSAPRDDSKRDDRDRSLPRMAAGKGGKDRHRKRSPDKKRVGGPMDLKPGESYDRVHKLEETGQAAMKEEDRVHREIDWTSKGKEEEAGADTTMAAVAPEGGKKEANIFSSDIKEYMNQWNSGGKDEWYGGKKKWNGSCKKDENSGDQSASAAHASSADQSKEEAKEAPEEEWNAKTGWSDAAWKKWQEEKDAKWAEWNQSWGEQETEKWQPKKIEPVKIEDRSKEEQEEYKKMLEAAKLGTKGNFSKGKGEKGKGKGAWDAPADYANWGGDGWDPMDESKKWNVWSNSYEYDEQKEAQEAKLGSVISVSADTSKGDSSKGSKSKGKGEFEGKGKSGKGKSKGKGIEYDPWADPAWNDPWAEPAWHDAGKGAKGEHFTKGGKKGKSKGEDVETWDWNATRSALPLGADFKSAPLGSDINLAPLGFTPRSNVMGLEDLEKMELAAVKKAQDVQKEDAKVEEARKASALRAANHGVGADTTASSKDVTMEDVTILESLPSKEGSKSSAILGEGCVSEGPALLGLSPRRSVEKSFVRQNQKTFEEKPFAFKDDNNVLSRMAAIESLRKRDPPDLTGGAFGLDKASEEHSAEFHDFTFTSTSTFENAKPIDTSSKSNPWQNDELPPAPADAESPLDSPPRVMQVPLPSNPWESDKTQTAEGSHRWDGGWDERRDERWKEDPPAKRRHVDIYQSGPPSLSELPSLPPGKDGMLPPLPPMIG